VGEVCTYTETWSVPTNDPAALQVYLTMFGEYLFNISNTSLWNITIDADSPAQFASRAEPLDLQQQRRLQDDGYLEENAYGETQIPQTIPWPAPVPVDWRNEFDLAQLFPDRLVDNPLTPYESQNLYNTIDCGLEIDAETNSTSIRPNMLIRIGMKFLSETERGFQACLTMTTQNAMRDLLAPFGMTPCRDRSYICRASLEVIPAPSPPPPDNWVRTPRLDTCPSALHTHVCPVACAGDSTFAARLWVSWTLNPHSQPAVVPHARSRFAVANRYEVEVAAVAGSGMGLYLMFACICCTVFGGRSMRARHHSRWFTDRLKRVQDAMPYKAEEMRREGEFYDHLTKGQLPARAHELAEDPSTTAAAHATFGTGLARTLFALPAGGAAPLAGSSASAETFTFASLVSDTDRRNAAAPRMLHKTHV
jgi:hypothetical protein